MFGRKPKTPPNAQKMLRILTAAALAVAFPTLLIRGLSLPWSEDGVLFALYGAGVGFALAILGSMGLLWLWDRKKRRRGGL